MIRNKFYYKVKTLIPNITELPINGLINELMNSSNYLAKKRTFFNQKQTRVDGALGTVYAYRVVFEKLTKNPRETEFSGDKTARLENDYHSGSSWKRWLIVLVWLYEN